MLTLNKTTFIAFSMTFLSALNALAATPTLMGGIAWGPGTAKSEVSYESRKMTAGRAHALLGLDFSAFTLGAMGQYLIVDQKTKPSEVGGSKLGSKGYLGGAGFATRIGSSVILQASYDFIGNQELKEKTSDGKTFSYTKPTGFTVILAYNFSSCWTIEALYSSHTYKSVKIDGTESSNDQDKFTQTFWGGGLGFVF